MAVDGGYGPKGYPKFDPNGAPEDWVDLEAVGQFAARVGNRMVGTKAEREALSTSTTVEGQMWNGLEFRETDTGHTYERVGGAWVRTSPFSAKVSASTNTFGVVTLNHDLGAVPKWVHVSPYRGSTDSAALWFSYVVWDATSTQIQVRVRRSDTGNWVNDAQVAGVYVTAGMA